MKMRKFNLAQALRGQPVCTMDGKTVTITAFIMGQEYPIVGIVHYNGHKYSESWTHSGRFYIGKRDSWDLMMVTEHENF